MCACNGNVVYGIGAGDLTLIRPSSGGTGIVAEVNVDFRVLKKDGSPVPYAQYWFIDDQSQPLSSVMLTDENGESFVVFQDTTDNASTRWVNFWAQGYDPVVKSVAELMSNEKVYLEPPGKKEINWELLLGTAGLGLTIFSMVKRKKAKRVGNIIDDAKARYNRSTTGQKVLVIGAGGLAAYIILNHFFGHQPTKEQKQEIDAAKDRLAELANLYGIFPTLSNAQYTAMANTIRVAVDDCGTDESAIYGAFNKLVNEADLMKLIIAYNVQHYKGCFEGNYFGDVTRTLSETLTGDLSASNISRVNSILRDKQINYTF